MRFLWNDWREELIQAIPLDTKTNWSKWEGKGDVNLEANIYSGPHILKAREAIIWDKKSCIYNIIYYPKTGSDLPAFGVDLLGFFEKKVVITFDFQHPTENYLLSYGELLPKCKKGIRFFEPGNHFSEHLYVETCTMPDIPDHLPMFKKYVGVYKDLLESEQPNGIEEFVYRDFDSYMKKLDPVAGYLSSKFGKERAEDFVENFLFSYG